MREQQMELILGVLQKDSFVCGGVQGGWGLELATKKARALGG